MGACSAYTSHNPNVADALTPTVALSVGGDFLGEITNFPLPGGDNKNLGAWLKISSFIFFQWSNPYKFENFTQLWGGTGLTEN